MELFQRRKLCREFLNGYNEKQHHQIISMVFEIGLLTLKKMFNKLLFTKDELDEIIKSLSGQEYIEIFPLYKMRKTEDNHNKTSEDYKIKDNTCLTEEEQLRNKIIKNKILHKNYLQNPNFTTQNKEIYPFWWWNNKEENINDIQNKARNINNNDEKYFNEEYYNNQNDFINNLNDNDINEEKFNPQQNYSYNDIPRESNNIDINHKIIPFKKVYAKQNVFNDNQKIENNKIIPKNNQSEQNKRVKSVRAVEKKNNIYINNQKENLKKKKLYKKIPNKEQGMNNNNSKKLHKFKDGRMSKLNDEMNHYGINKINMTEPNNNY